MSIAEEARKAQFADLDPESEIGKAAAAVYGGIDGLNRAQKSLLVRQALVAAHSNIMALGENPASPGVQGWVMLAAGLVAIVGYTHETVREDDGMTMTGDQAVLNVLNNFRNLIGAMAKGGMSDEQKAHAEALSVRVNTRVEKTGENFEAVVADEIAKENAAPPEDQDEEGTPTGPVDGSYGMYL